MGKLSNVLKVWLSNIALLAGTLLFLSIAAEISTRVFTSTPASLKYSNPDIGEHYRPGYSGTVYVDEADREVFVRFNQDGFRGPDRPRNKPDGVHRVALLGDSFIAAFTVDEEDTAAAQLERLLGKSHPTERWEVLNFGVSGASTGTELVLWSGLVRDYEPDIVLLAFFVGNDLTDNSAELNTKPRIYFELDDEGALRQRHHFGVQKRGTNWLNSHSRFYVWQKTAVRKLRVRSHLTFDLPTIEHYIFCTEPPEKFERAWLLTEALLGRFRQEVEAAGCRFAVVLIPTSMQIYDDYLEQGQLWVGENFRLDSTAPDRRIEDICRRLGISVLPMRQTFRDASPSHTLAKKDEWLFFQGIGHFNERGNRLAAAEMHRFLDGTFLTNTAGSGSPVSSNRVTTAPD